MTGRGVRKESEQFPEIAHTPGGRAKSLHLSTRDSAAYKWRSRLRHFQTFRQLATRHVLRSVCRQFYHWALWDIISRSKDVRSCQKSVDLSKVSGARWETIPNNMFLIKVHFFYFQIGIFNGYVQIRLKISKGKGVRKKNSTLR